MIKSSLRSTGSSTKTQQSATDRANSVRLESFENLRERYFNFIKKSFGESVQITENMRETEKQIAEAQIEQLDLERQIQRVSKQRSLLFRNSRQYAQN
jgi:hypothetical protein